MHCEEPLPVKVGEWNPCYEHKCHLPAVSWEPREVKQPIMVKQNIPENQFPNNKHVTKPKKKELKPAQHKYARKANHTPVM